MCKERFDPNKHAQEDLLKDGFDKKIQWAVNQISWIIRQVGLYLVQG